MEDTSMTRQVCEMGSPAPWDRDVMVLSIEEDDLYDDGSFKTEPKPIQFAVELVSRKSHQEIMNDFFAKLGPYPKRKQINN